MKWMPYYSHSADEDMDAWLHWEWLLRNLPKVTQLVSVTIRQSVCRAWALTEAAPPFLTVLLPSSLLSWKWPLIQEHAPGALGLLGEPPTRLCCPNPPEDLPACWSAPSVSFWRAGIMPRSPGVKEHSTCAHAHSGLTVHPCTQWANTWALVL